MSFWKQLLLSVVILVAAAALWVRFFPGAPDLLARWGLDWVPVATATTSPAQEGNGRGEGRRNAGVADSSVVAEPVTTVTINDRLSAIGTGRANNSVVVSPFASGRLTEVLVESGSTVEAGDVLARLDADAEEIAVDRARIALEDAQARFQRVSTLASSNAVTAVQKTQADLDMRNASLALRDAELALERRSIIAPIDGVVGIFSVTVGNYVTSQTEIVTIDDRSQILVDFWVPERFASFVELGAPITATSIARASEVFQGRVSAIDNRIDPQSRTLKLRASITNPADVLRAGMSFKVEMRFPGDSYPAVNPLAIQWGADGSFVWSVVDGTARRVPVTIVQRNTDTVLVKGDIQPATMVVTEGIHLVRDGAPISIVGEAGGQAISGAERPHVTASGT